ncbi:AmiS/UreI family transporter [Tsukamurella paurometabola]|uniref:Transporter n=1 Tax=Tsukamurella paurometabola TaxID=2061 RepID=A0ABS5NCH3_TSUPA|nr:AmiS/UreI family transporter [Tsukamurella paurometabola]MBS4101989.1 transporter [Tsukamurella paurometabola]
MTTLGLLFVGAVLFVNGAWFLGAISAREAGVFNLFVGAMQVVLPTLAVVAADGDLGGVFGAGSSYLFGFTYLFVGVNNLMGNDGRGLGWYSIFVTAMAIVFGGYSLATDPVFGVIWFVWAVMWLMFFLILACGRTALMPFTGWLILIGSHLTCTIPALMAWRGSWPTSASAALWAAVIAVALLAVSAVAARTAPTLPLSARDSVATPESA